MSTLLSLAPEQPAVMRLGLTLLHFLWQGTLVALLAAVVRRQMHAAAAPAYLRRRTAILFLSVTALCPVVTFAVLSPDAPPIPYHASGPGGVLKAAESGVPASRATLADQGAASHSPSSSSGIIPNAMVDPGLIDAEKIQMGAADPIAAMVDGPFGKPRRHPDPKFTYLRALLPWVVAGWALGVLLLAVRQAGGWWLMRRWRRETLPAPEPWEHRLAELAGRLGIRRVVRLLSSVSGHGPALAGIVSPVILIPVSAFTGMNPAYLEAVLLHELAHFRQRDHWVTVLLTVAGTLLFYHPAVWLLCGWVRAEREHAADERAAAACGDRGIYVRALAGLAACGKVPRAGAGLAADGGHMVNRIRRLLGRGEPEPRVLSGGLLPALAAAAGALCLVLPSTAQTSGRDNAGTPEPVPSPATAADSPVPAAAGAPATTTTTAPAAGVPPLQARIDAAQEGAVIRLEAGVVEANLLITKPVILEGAGESQTFIRQKSLEAGPVITLRGAKKVVIRGLRVIAQPLESDGDTLASSGAVEAENAEFTFEKCSITGPCHNGIVLKASSAAIRDCLISGMWSNGITVGKGSHDVSITGSDIRNCYYTPVVIGRGTERVTIDRCRISGGAWHGIRYDDASPEITNSLIFQNARCGIYASGRTSAVIRGNVFLGNEMGAIACWAPNQDTIEGNTFVDNKRESIAVQGGSKPVIRRNIIVDSPVAFFLGKAEVKGKEAPEEAAPVITDNLLWNTAREMVRSGKDETLDDATNTLRTDPQFADAKARDFRLAENSPAAKQGAGAADPLSLREAWPLTEEEKEIIPDGESRSYELWKTQGYKQRRDEAVIQKQTEQAHAKAESLRTEALQIDSVERRDAAIAAIRGALESGDPQVALPGLMALSGSVAAEFDKTPFRPLVRKWMTSKNPALRNAALTAMVQLGAEPADLDALYTMAEKKETPDRASLVIYLHWIGKGDLTGRGGKVVLELLADDDQARQKSVLNAIWGASYSKELEDRVIALSRSGDHQMAYDAVYYALSPQANKSAQSIDRLMEIMGGREGDPQRASWGLGQGISKAVAPHLMELAVKLFADNVSPLVRGWCLNLVKTYGSRRELPFLDQTAARPAVTSTIRKAVEEAKTAITARNGEYGSTVREAGAGP